MADVELVIKISKELYDLVQNKLDFNGDLDKQKVKALMFAIDNGTPLPKGHGRLIDKDALGEKLHIYTEAPYQYALTVFNESPIIINADRSEDE